MMNTKLMGAIERTQQRTTRKQRTPTKRATVGVVGLGYVGLPLAVAIERHGYQVIGYDVDSAKIAKLKAHDATTLSPDEADSFKQSSMRFGSHPRVLEHADAYVICVPTPVTEAKEPDLTALIGASQTVGRALKRGALVIVESTVNPGICEEVVIPTLERSSGLKVTRDFYFAYCPERINPGDPNYGVHNIPRVLGASDEESLHIALQFYRSVIDAEIFPMGSIKEAEAVKMVENSFRDINIAFVNELAMAFERAGIDTVNVIRGASTKPFGFMAHYPSCGVGGHCIPVDPYYLIQYGKKNGFTHQFLMTARNINNLMPHYTVALLEETLRENHKALHGSSVALLGIAYKRGISDMRESPAMSIIADLKEAGAEVHVYDPHVPEHSTATTLDEVLEKADAVIIATDHEAFCSLGPSDFLRHNISIVIDGKNCLDKKAFESSGVTYRGIGR